MLDKAADSSSVKHLIIISEAVRDKSLDLNWLNECLSLSGSLRPAVNMVDLFLNCNHRV